MHKMSYSVRMHIRRNCIDVTCIHTHLSLYVHTYIYIYTLMYIYMYIYIDIHTHYICCICMYVYRYICICKQQLNKHYQGPRGYCQHFISDHWRVLIGPEVRSPKEDSGRAVATHSVGTCYFPSAWGATEDEHIFENPCF